MTQLSDTFWLDLDEIESVRAIVADADGGTNHTFLATVADMGYRHVGGSTTYLDRWTYTTGETIVVVITRSGRVYDLRGDIAKTFRDRLDEWRSR